MRITPFKNNPVFKILGRHIGYLLLYIIARFKIKEMKY